jgi:hypothetical protein
LSGGVPAIERSKLRGGRFNKWSQVLGNPKQILKRQNPESGDTLPLCWSGYSRSLRFPSFVSNLSSANPDREIKLDGVPLLR